MAVWGWAEELTVGQVGQLWLRRAELDELEVSTLRQYEQHLRLHIEPLIGAHLLNQLSRPALEEFKDSLLRTRSRAMSRKVLTSLKGILGEAVRLGHAPENAALHVRVTAPRRRGRQGFGGPVTNASLPSKLEIRTLLLKSQRMFSMPEGQGVRGWNESGTWWHAFFLVALFTGMRASEIRGLTWDNVDLDRHLIHVRQRANFKSELGLPKSAAAHRDIPMAPIVRDTLSRWQTHCPPTMLKLVFPSRNGRIQTNSNIHKMCWAPLQLATGITKTREKADGVLVQVPRLTFHSLRHTAASLFIEQGWSPKKVQAVLGHSSIQVTFDIYGKLWNDLESDLAKMAILEEQLLR